MKKTFMRIYTGRACLMEAALVDTLRRGMELDAGDHIVVVPKQLTLQTERTLLDALNLQGSFRLQVLSPDRLCGRIFEHAGQPEGVRVDERGRIMLVRAAVHAVDDRLKLYRGKRRQHGFAERCARQLELFRQAGLTPREVIDSAGRAEGLLSLKLDDLGVILEAYEGLLEGRFQDGETEFSEAVLRAGDADFLRGTSVYFYGFDLTPPSLHRLIGAIGGACEKTHVFLPLNNDENARDRDAWTPLRNCLDRLILAARQAGVWPEQIRVESTGTPSPNRLVVPAPLQAEELSVLAQELFAFPVQPSASDRAPSHLQVVTLKTPLEECLFAAALCRRLAMTHRWKWGEMLILCRDLDNYRQPLKEAFRAFGVPLFLSSSRPASRHPLAECLTDALRLMESEHRIEDALALLHTGYMPLEPEQADRLCNHAEKYGLKPWALMRPLRRGTQAERQALEPLRERFAAPLIALKQALKRSARLKDQLAALFDFLTQIGAAEKLHAHLQALIDAGLREQAGEEGQVWNRLIGALDQMAGLLGEAPLPVSELRQTLTESLDAAVIKPLPQSSDAVYAQTTDRITAQPVRALLILGESDKAIRNEEGLLDSAQTQACARLTRTWLGSDGTELSRMRRFYLKSAVEMASDYLCVSCPLSGPDGASQRPGSLLALLRGIFPALSPRGGVTDDPGIQWMLRAAPRSAAAFAARSLSALVEGEPLAPWDAAALAGLQQIASDPQTDAALRRMHGALRRNEAADALDPATARALYGRLRRQSITRLEQYAECPFAYFTQRGLCPERIEPYRLTPQDEGTFFHEAVREFLTASMEDLNTLEAPEARSRMGAIADRLLAALADEGPLGDSAASLAERRRLRATACACAVVLAEHMQGSRFAPAALETDFGVEDGPAQLRVNASSGTCTLEGRIDRIDDWAESGYLRVIDYKRGGKPLALDGVYHGLDLQLPVYLAAATQKRSAQSAGVYYFTVDEGILTTQSLEADAVDAQRREHFRMTGLAPDDIDLLEALSPDFQNVLNVKLNNDGTPSKSSLVTDAAGFRALTKKALEKAAEHLDDIRSGRVEAAPAEFHRRQACQYCRWRAICQFDDRLDASRIRHFDTMPGSAVLTKLKLEM